MEDTSNAPKPLLGATTPGSAPVPHKPVIKSVDMDKAMEDRAIELALEGLGKFSMEKDLAEYLKREFDRLYGVTWHAVVGKKWVPARCMMESIPIS